jgi:hypothetical protein
MRKNKKGQKSRIPAFPHEEKSLNNQGFRDAENLLYLFKQ